MKRTRLPGRGRVRSGERRDNMRKRHASARADIQQDPFRAFVLRWFANVGLALTALRFLSEQLGALIASLPF